MAVDVSRKEREILLWEIQAKEKQRIREEGERLMAGLAQENLYFPVRNHFLYIGH